jgi:hypothetical protein
MFYVMKIDLILKDLIANADMLRVSPTQKKMLLENWHLLSLGQKKDFLRLLDREGLYKQAMLRVEVETNKLTSKHE